MVCFLGCLAPYTFFLGRVLGRDINSQVGCRESTRSWLFFLRSYMPAEINIQKDRHYKGGRTPCQHDSSEHNRRVICVQRLKIEYKAIRTGATVEASWGIICKEILSLPGKQTVGKIGVKVKFEKPRWVKPSDGVEWSHCFGVFALSKVPWPWAMGLLGSCPGWMQCSRASGRVG